LAAVKSLKISDAGFFSVTTGLGASLTGLAYLTGSLAGVDTTGAEVVEAAVEGLVTGAGVVSISSGRGASSTIGS